MLQYLQIQEEQVYTASPWDWSFDVSSYIGSPGLGSSYHMVKTCSNMWSAVHQQPKEWDTETTKK